ncbi:hypothetical protein [Intrasporangium sp.]|uniref:hypothetical protein n=1 Tax=Intrasporangium sp. TaxID=1925024 RepID=UPI0032217434
MTQPLRAPDDAHPPRSAPSAERYPLGSALTGPAHSHGDLLEAALVDALTRATWPRGGRIIEVDEQILAARVVPHILATLPAPGVVATARGAARSDAGARRHRHCVHPGHVIHRRLARLPGLVARLWHRSPGIARHGSRPSLPARPDATCTPSPSRPAR